MINKFSKGKLKTNVGSNQENTFNRMSAFTSVMRTVKKGNISRLSNSLSINTQTVIVYSMSRNITSETWW